MSTESINLFLLVKNEIEKKTWRCSKAYLLLILFQEPLTIKVFHPRFFLNMVKLNYWGIWFYSSGFLKMTLEKRTFNWIWFDWIWLHWITLDWSALNDIGLHQIELDCIALNHIALNSIALNWIVWSFIIS